MRDTFIGLIQKTFCTETELFQENVLTRLKYLEDKVAAQGTEIAEVRKTNAYLLKSNNDLRETVTELQETNNDLRESITELQESNYDLRQTVTELELKESNNNLRESITELQDTNNGLRELITELQETNNGLRESITELKGPNDKHSVSHPITAGTYTQHRQTKSEANSSNTFYKRVKFICNIFIKTTAFFMNNEGPIAFTAAIKPLVINHLKHMDTIKFETVITDIGGGYNNQSGVFVAPATGIYMFSCSLMDDGQSGLMVYAEIVQNQRVLGQIFSHAEANTHRDQGAQTVFTPVNQGDQIWVRTIDNPDLGL